jgi:excisionase family DNA binding protein
MPHPTNLPNPTPADDQAVRVSISEAAKLFGVNPRTIRRALAAGDIRYIVVGGRYKLHFGSLVGWSQKTPTVRNKRDAKGIGQWVDQWRIKNTKFSPRPPQPSSNE